MFPRPESTNGNRRICERNAVKIQGRSKKLDLGSRTSPKSIFIDFPSTLSALLAHLPPTGAHFGRHLVDQAVFQNPTRVWTYNFEDFVGKAAELASKCSRGTPKKSLSKALMSKYRDLIYLRLQQKLRATSSELD